MAKRTSRGKKSGGKPADASPNGGIDIKVRLDDVLEALETKYPAKLKGLLPRIYPAPTWTLAACAA
jgi:hypothetical protein